MRRPALSRPDDFDLDARELAKAAARRAGLSLEDWAAAILAEHREDSRPAMRKAASDLDNLIARMSQSSRSQTKRDYETLMAAIAAETEREAQEQASRTAMALESMATWIEQAEDRLNDTARASADQQDRIAAILSEAMTSMKERLDTVERQVASERSAPPRIAFPMEEALKALAPVSQNLAGLRADMSRLAAHLERTGPTLQPAVEAIRSEIADVRAGIDALATRSEIAALDASLGSLAKDLGQGPTTRDLQTLAGSITVLYERVQSLSEEIGEDMHGRLADAIDLIKTRIDTVAKTGIDRSVIDFLSSQIVDLRQDLANRAEPQQVGRLADEVGTLGRQIAELRLHQANKGDFAALKNSLDDVCSALYVTATAQETSRVPEQLESLGRRIDLLTRRPDPAPVDLAPVSEQLALMTEHMANLSGGRPDGGAALSDMMERLSSKIEAVAEREVPSQEPLIERFDRIEQELRQLGERTDTASLAEQVLRALDEKLKGTAPPAGLEALERQIAALGERLDRNAETTGGHARALRDEAAGIAERAARTALTDIRATLPAAGDLDTLKHGFVELKALHSRSDRKTQETLRAVHEALEALASRLPGQVAPPAAASASPDPLPPADRLEAAVRRLHAATLSQIESAAPATDQMSQAASTAQAPAPGSTTGSATLLSVPEADNGHLRASFIAAARRAAQGGAETDRNAPSTSETEPAPDDGHDETGEDEPASATLFERLRRSLDGQRRPLLFGLAFLILAAGSALILSGDRNAPSPAASSLSSAVMEPVSSPAPKMAEAGSAAAETNLFQASTLSTGSVAPTPWASGQFLVDPATIGVIPTEAPAALRQAALAGEAAALYEIAAQLAEGRGMAQDMAMAARLFERAAQAGLPPAQERFATMFEKGTGVSRDLKQAAFWYERAALGGNVRAMHNLATLLASGSTGKPDYAAALRWFGEAAEAGFRDSQFNMGILLARGIGAKPDLQKAFQWFSLAAAQGDEEAVRKRDELALRLAAADIRAAKGALELWRARPVDPIANRPPAADDGRTVALDRSAADRS